MKRRLALLGVLLLLLLAGCVSTTWYRQGASTTDLNDAIAACRDTAKVATIEFTPTLSGEAVLKLPDREFNGELFDRCMRERGYTRVTTRG